MASAKVQTVLGPIDPENLGRTLSHEHLTINYTNFFEYQPLRESDLKAVDLNQITLRNVHWVRQNPYSHKFNISFGDEPVEEIIKEVAELKKEGGSSIVDITSIGIQPNVQKLKKISLATGLNIISGTGFYADQSIPSGMKSLSVEELSNFMMKDLTAGVDNTNIKCGLIGEMAGNWPLTPFEKKALKAAAIVQTATGAPLAIRPGFDQHAPIEHARVFQEAGGNLNKTALTHIDRTVFDREALLDLTATGCYLVYDFFGLEMVHYYTKPDIDLPSDSQRVKEIKFLVDEGFEDQILISLDIHTRHRLLKYGGHGYCHIQVNIIPKMLNRGISQEVIDKIQIANPKAWLTFK